MKEKKIIVNKYDFTWNSGKSKTTFYQEQGVDIRIMQEDYTKMYAPYSHPAHQLFACILRYFIQLDDYPKLEQINNINKLPRQDSNWCDGNVPARILIKTYLNEELPSFENEKIKITSIINTGWIGSTLSGGSLEYCCYVKDESFIIGSLDSIGIERVLVTTKGEEFFDIVKPIMIFDDGDALNILKGIYYFSPNKQLLREVYNSRKK